MARDIFPELVTILNGDNPYLRKKVCLTLIKMISIAPDLVEGIVRSLPALLIDNDHGVLIAGSFLHQSSKSFLAIQLTLVVLQHSPDYISRFRRLVPRLVKRLRVVTSGNGKAECAVGSVPDPFVQITMLKLLRVLAVDDEQATENVADVVTSVGQ